MGGLDKWPVPKHTAPRRSQRLQLPVRLPSLQQNHLLAVLTVQCAASRKHLAFLFFTFVALSFSSIPFFFEPNFDALIAPLPAALRLQEEDRAVRGVHGGAPRKTYQPVVYGDFLLRKVGSNFDTGKGRYDEN